MTDDTTRAAAAAISLTAIETCQAMGFSPEDAAAVVVMGLGEALAQIMGGPVAAAEGLRDMADIIERQVL